MLSEKTFHFQYARHVHNKNFYKTSGISAVEENFNGILLKNLVIPFSFVVSVDIFPNCQGPAWTELLRWSKQVVLSVVENLALFLKLYSKYVWTDAHSTIKRPSTDYIFKTFLVSIGQDFVMARDFKTVYCTKLLSPQAATCVRTVLVMVITTSKQSLLVVSSNIRWLSARLCIVDVTNQAWRQCAKK